MLLAVALVAAACGGDDDDAAAPDESERLSLTFMAGFRAQSNLPFIAAYVAEQEGFFDAVGLDVTIRHSAGQGEHVRLLLAGDIGVTTQPASELLQRRSDPGAPLVAVALFGQTGDLGYAVLADSGITSPADFAGKVVGFKGVVQAEFLAMLRAHGLSEDDIDLVTTGFNPVVLSEGELDVYPVFLSNEPDTLERVIGVPVRVFQAADFGVPTLGVTYVVSEDFLASAQKREALRR
ncbi:MAG: ABC transporter substrate-binding protein, partial [Dehalococcoidia bacterium]